MQKEVQEDDIDKSHWGELESESESEEESSEESEAEADETGLVTPAEGYVIVVLFDANHLNQLMREYLHFQYISLNEPCFVKCIHLRNKFEFWNVHVIMNTLDLLQNK